MSADAPGRGETSTLTIHRLDPEEKDRLRLRATRHGRSWTPRCARS